MQEDVCSGSHPEVNLLRCRPSPMSSTSVLVAALLVVLMGLGCGQTVIIQDRLIGSTKVIGASGDVLALADGRSVHVPHADSLIAACPELALGIEYHEEVGLVFGIVPILHNCGTDRIVVQEERIPLIGLAHFIEMEGYLRDGSVTCFVNGELRGDVLWRFLRATQTEWDGRSSIVFDEEAIASRESGDHK